MTQISATTTEPIRLNKEYKDFVDVFSTENASHLAFNEDHDYVINVIDGKKTSYRPIYSPFKNELSILPKYFYKNLANRFIWSSKSSAGALIYFVPRADGGFWPFVDYRNLNNLTIKNRYSPFLVDNSLDRLGGAKKYTKLDFTSVYYRIRIKKRDKWKTTFWTRYSQYKYYVMPFGLANAPASFHSYINKCLAEKLDMFCIVYLDDILTYISERKAQLEEAVRCVLE